MIDEQGNYIYTDENGNTVSSPLPPSAQPSPETYAPLPNPAPEQPPVHFGEPAPPPTPPPAPAPAPVGGTTGGHEVVEPEQPPVHFGEPAPPAPTPAPVTQIPAPPPAPAPAPVAVVAPVTEAPVPINVNDILDFNPGMSSQEATDITNQLNAVKGIPPIVLPPAEPVDTVIAGIVTGVSAPTKEQADAIIKALESGNTDLTKIAAEQGRIETAPVPEGQIQLSTGTIMDKEVFDRQYTKLGDGSYMLTAIFDNLSPEEKQLATEQGQSALDTYQTWDTARKEELLRQSQEAAQMDAQAAMDTIARTKDVAPTDLQGLLNAGVDADTLVRAGNSVEDVNSAIDAINRKAQEQYRYELKQAQFENEDAQRLADIQNNALAALKAYKVGDGSNRHPYAYNISQYLLDTKNPGESLQTLRDAGFQKETIVNAARYNNDVAAAANEKARFNTTPLGVVMSMAESSKAWVDKRLADYAKNIEKNPFIPGRAISSAVAGLARVGADTVLGAPLIAGNFFLDPSGTAIGAVKGTLNQAGKFVYGLSETYPKAILKGDLNDLAYDGVMTYLIAEGGVKMSGAALRGGQFLATVARTDYVPMRSMSIEASTARVPFKPTQIAAMRKAGISDVDILNAGTEINQQLASGVKVAKVTLGPVKVSVKNVEYQKDVGMSLFNSTPDITLIDRGGSVPLFKDFYTAAKVAIEPLGRSYTEGRPATAPGVVEIKISDPSVIKDIMPQQKTFVDNKGRLTLEPEAVLPSMDTLRGMGYHLDPIPGPAGRGMTFDANLGPIPIRRYTLSKVVDNPTGLQTTVLGSKSPTGTVAIGDLHGTTNYRSVFEDINSAFKDPVLKGDPAKPATWNWIGEKQNVVILGDSIDRGPAYNTWRTTFNRLSDQASATGGNVSRLLGNHELAYLSNDAIKGITYTDKLRADIKSGLVQDITSGKVKAAAAYDGTLYSHAGVSSGVFKNFKGKTASFVADDLNGTLLKAVKGNDYSGKMFAKGRTEKGNSLSGNERSQGGPFWLRPQEATVPQLDLGFTQVVGHNPGWAPRRMWGDKFVEVDVSRRTGGKGVYADTPYAKTQPAVIGTKAIPGKVEQIPPWVRDNLSVKAMRDTIADVFLGWDGRIKAIENIVHSERVSSQIVKGLREQIKVRKAAGDSVGVKYLKRQISEITSPTGHDYLYGGIGFWRDIVMGRRNSVRVRGGLSKASRPVLMSAVGYINSVRSSIGKFSNTDVSSMFGMSRNAVLTSLDTSGLRGASTEALRAKLPNLISNLTDVVDSGLARSVAPYMDSAAITSRYSGTLQNTFNQYSSDPGSVDAGTPSSYNPYRTPEQGSSTGSSGVREVRTPGSSGSTGRESSPTAPRGGSPSRPGREERATPPEMGRVSGRSPQPPARGTRAPTPGRTPTPVRVPPTRVDRIKRTSPPPNRGVRSTPPTIPPVTITRPPPNNVETPITMPVMKRGSYTTPEAVPDGSIVFAFGKSRGRPVWKVMSPDDIINGVKPRTLYEAPIGAINTGSASPYDTIQVLGKQGAGVPETVTIDLGVTDAIISNYGKNIRFGGKGLGTDIGTRVSSPTQGMSVPGAMMGEPDEILGRIRTPVARKTAVSRPKHKRSSWLDDLVGLKGFKP